MGHTMPTRDVPGEEVSEVHKLAVFLVLDVDDAPTCLASPDGLAVNNDATLRTDNRKGNHVLHTTNEHSS